MLRSHAQRHGLLRTLFTTLTLVSAIASACVAPAAGTYEAVEFTSFDDTCYGESVYPDWEGGTPFPPVGETYTMVMPFSGFFALSRGGLFLGGREARCRFDGPTFACDAHQRAEKVDQYAEHGLDHSTETIESWMVGEWLDDETVVIDEFQRGWCIDDDEWVLPPRKCLMPEPPADPCIRERSGTWVWVGEGADDRPQGMVPPGHDP